jgi:hypothetical protein
VSSRLAEKERRRQERLESERASVAGQTRRRRLWVSGTGALALLALAAVVALLVNDSGGSNATKVVSSDRDPFGQHYVGLVQRREAAGVPTMAQTVGSPVHTHPRLNVYVDGKPITVPANIGIDPRVDPMQMAGLHTHDASGTIHVEGVAGARLGQFFQVWGVSFSARQLGTYRGGAGRGVRMWVDGKPSHAFGALRLADGQRIVVSYGPMHGPPPSG